MESIIPWRFEVAKASFVVAETTTLAAADAVERLYAMAYDERRERPEYGISTHVARWATASGRLDYDNHVTLKKPMSEGEVEAWFNRMAGPRGCAYCGGEHSSDSCLGVRQKEARR